MYHWIDQSRSLAAVGRQLLVALAAAVLFCLAPAGYAATMGAAEYHKAIQPILEKYCYDCHGGGEHKGGVALDGLKSDQEILGTPELWWRVLKDVRAGLMPPKKEDQPTADDKLRLAEWIKYGAFGIDKAAPDPGRVTIRRLNRVEYRRTIQDLMGVDYDTGGEFPADDTGYGFDTIGDALSISPLLLEKYMEAAQQIVGQAVPMSAKHTAMVSVPGGEFRSEDQSQRADRLSFDRAANISGIIEVAHPGTYILHMNLLVRGEFDFDPGRCRLTMSVNGRQKWQQELGWSNGKKTEISLTEQLEKGKCSLHFDLQPLMAANHPHSNIRLEIGPVQLEGPTEPQYLVFTDHYHQFFPRDEVPGAKLARRQYARELLDGFTRKAFRRPADPQTLDRLAQLAELVYMQRGKTFEQGIAQAMVAVLASPRFIFRIEQSDLRRPDEPISPIDEYSLASRLSYFLWSSMPDDKLFELAAQGQLRKNLSQQVARMLADPRSDAMVKNFTGQWLQLRDLDGIPINVRVVTQQDNSLSPNGVPTVAGNIANAADANAGNRVVRNGQRRNRFQLDFALRQALREEPERVFSRVIHENRSLIELIECDYTFINASLAKLYNIPNIDGEEMRLYKLPPGSPRGGVLTMGSFLVLTSNPTRTSPVKRGQFILDNILGMPSPPPPPNVPPLEEAEKGISGHQPSFRQILETHRKQPMCSSCHSRMDPLGLSLENFNALGMWRTMERGQAIDATGKLTTGESFHDIQELKKIIEDGHRDAYYRCVTEKMMTYALGRGLDYYDVDAVDRIVARIEQSDGRASALLSGIIESVPFQERRNRADNAAPKAPHLSPAQADAAAP